jgi:hypothetical protein
MNYFEPGDHVARPGHFPVAMAGPTHPLRWSLAMSQRLLRAGITFCLIACAGSRAFALDPEKWFKIKNESKKDYILSITDWKLVMGNIYLKEMDDTSDGLKLSGSRSSAALLANKEYLCYFDPTGGFFALTFTISRGDDSTDFNLKRAPKVGDRLVISPSNTLSDSPIAIDMSGFGRRNGPAFLTIH